MHRVYASNIRLFTCYFLVLARRETADPRNDKKVKEANANAGSVSGSGEYTLVYEDNEGDRILVGDVPWQ